MVPPASYRTAPSVVLASVTGQVPQPTCSTVMVPAASSTVALPSRGSRTRLALLSPSATTLACVEFYAVEVDGRDVLVLSGDHQAGDGVGHYRLTDRVLDVADEFGVERAFALGGVPTGELIEEYGPPGDAEERTGRDVVVPMRVYKTVTVFSTLIAVLAVVTGFVLLDAATLGVSVLRELVVLGLSAVGLSVPDGALSAAFAALGLAVIAAGAGVYVLGTRFRARGMGNSQEDSGEGSDNG